jgi:hypothetical protein
MALKSRVGRLRRRHVHGAQDSAGRRMTAPTADPDTEARRLTQAWLDDVARVARRSAPSSDQEDRVVAAVVELERAKLDDAGVLGRKLLSLMNAQIEAAKSATLELATADQP